MLFPVVMYRCESWAIKKVEHQRIDAFKFWYWRTLLRVSWTAMKSNQSILTEINPEYSLEGLILKLKLRYFGHQMWTTKSLEKTLMLGQKEKRVTGNKTVEWHLWFNGHEPGEILGDGEGLVAWYVAVHGVKKSWTLLGDWTITA